MGNSVTTENIFDHLDSIDSGPDDVVILYFTTHGYRTLSKTGIWPNLYFSNNNTGLDFETAYKIVQDKKPRLLIALADSCNNVLPEDSIDLQYPKHKAMMMAAALNVEGHYRKLFLETEGTIIISSAIPDQFSWYFPQKGGIFTLKFLESLNESVHLENDWESMLQMTTLKLSEEVAVYGEIQTPQYEINLVQKE